MTTIKTRIMNFAATKETVTLREIKEVYCLIRGIPLEQAPKINLSLALCGADRSRLFCGYLRRPSKVEPRYLNRVARGVYALAK